MDIRKPFLKSFTVKELIQFIDHYIEHREILHVPEHPWEVCDLVARFLGFGYSRRWSEDEIAVLSENFTPLGAEETSKLLPMRTAYDCKRKADYLGLCTNVKTSQKKDAVIWSIYELDILSKYYPIIGQKVMVLLPGRTEAACTRWAKKLGISAQPAELWSKEELQTLKSKYPDMGSSIRRFLPGRSGGAIRSIAFKTGVLSQSKEWTPEEDEIIKTLYPQMGRAIVSLFDGRRTESACQSRASFLGVQNPMKNLEWTERELEILKEHYPSMSRGVVALLPGRTETACKSMAAKLNLVTSVRKRPVGKKWTEEEIKILKEVYPKAGAAGVHNLLPNRSVTACRAMAIKHGVAVYHTKWSDEEIEILKSNYHKLGQDVAELLPGRNIATCQKKAGERGFHSASLTGVKPPATIGPVSWGYAG